jgi:hypothetical protein
MQGGGRLSGRELERQHNSRLVELLLTHPDHLARLRSAQLVFALCLAGIGREYPGLDYASSSDEQAAGQGHPFPAPLYAKLVEVSAGS